MCMYLYTRGEEKKLEHHKKVIIKNIVSGKKNKNRNKNTVSKKNASRVVRKYTKRGRERQRERERDKKQKNDKKKKI